MLYIVTLLLCLCLNALGQAQLGSVNNMMWGWMSPPYTEEVVSFYAKQYRVICIAGTSGIMMNIVILVYLFDY